MVTPKTIYLESDEEITSVIDKIRKTDFSDVVLVIPKGATITQSVVNLKLIKKKAESLNKNISIVTADKVARTLAEKVGIESAVNLGSLGTIPTEAPINSGASNDPLLETNEVIFDKESIGHIEPEELKITEGEDTEAAAGNKEDLLEKIRENEKPKGDNLMPKFPWKKVLIIGGVVLAALLAAAYIYLPQAKATIFVNSEKKAVTLDISGQKGVKLDTEKAILPTQVVEVTKEASKKFPATGKKNVGNKASGAITIFNKTGESITLVSGTGFSPKSNPSLVFRSQGSITINFLDKATATIEADTAGASYNGFTLADFFVTKIGQGASDSQFSIKSGASGMQGGTDKSVGVVTQGDYDAAKDSLVKSATEEATADFNTKANGKKLIESTKKTEVVSVSSTPDVGEEGDSFTVNVKISIKALAVSNSDLSALIKAEVKRQLGVTKEIIDDGSDNTNFKADAANLEEGTLSGTLTSTAYVAPKLDQEKIIINLEGFNDSQAKNYLLGQDGVDSVKLEYFPSFISSFPRIKEHIYVIVKVSDSSRD